MSTNRYDIFATSLHSLPATCAGAAASRPPHVADHWSGSPRALFAAIAFGGALQCVAFGVVIKLLDHSCETRSATACVDEVLRPLTDAFAAATFANRAACDGGDAHACFEIAWRATQDGSGDAARATPLYERACDAGHGLACNNLGVHYAGGIGVERDVRRAADLYDRACASGRPLGCANLGSAYQSGRGRELALDRAVHLFRSACDRKEHHGCVRLGALHMKGEGVELDRQKALRMFDDACDADAATGCHALANAYRRGEGVDVDRERALRLYRRACDDHVAAACRDLATFYAGE